MPSQSVQLAADFQPLAPAESPPRAAEPPRVACLLLSRHVESRPAAAVPRLGDGTRRRSGLTPLGLGPEAPPPAAWTRCESYLKAAIVAGAGLILLALLATGRFSDRPWSLPHHWLGRTFWFTMMTYAALMYAALIWRIILWRRYRPMLAVEDARLPSVSIIIPAYNEGALVRQAILSAAASRYPADRLEIIVVDDGSTDDTWRHIAAAAEQVRTPVAGARIHSRTSIDITTLRYATNRGKRRALYLGFTHARGDVFVTVDSDSVLDPDALRHAVAPLVRDPAVGCVAGCVQVLNAGDSLMTRFLKCTFSMSFKFVRAYQNEFRGVFCTPGALSVYRADVVRRIADEWLNQRFLGRRCVTGEDRAMTNLFLREGWLTAYQGNAVVRCQMPDTFGGLVRMFLRWARSNIRETVFLFRFLFAPFRTRHLLAFRFNMILATLAMIVPVLLIFNSTTLLLTNGDYFLRHLGIVILYAMTTSLIYYRNERDSDWVWLFLYGFFWVPCVSWIMPYALLTLRNTGWLTRRPAAQSPPAVCVAQSLPALA